MDALNIAKQRKVLDKALEVSVPSEVYEEIERIING